MMLLSVRINMEKITAYTLDQIPLQIDKIIEPFHLKWLFDNHYIVEAGYDEELEIRGAVNALESTEWMKGAVHVFVGRETIRCRLDEINVDAMTEPDPQKMNHYRLYFKNRGISEYCLTYPNVIVVNEKKELLDGYVTYLLMRERGLTWAECVLANSDVPLKKYIYGIYLPEDNKRGSQKEYCWAYPLNQAVVPGDILLADTRYGEKLIKVTYVDVGTNAYVKSMRKVIKFVGENELFYLVSLKHRKLQGKQKVITDVEMLSFKRKNDAVKWLAKNGFVYGTGWRSGHVLGRKYWFHKDDTAIDYVEVQINKQYKDYLKIPAAEWIQNLAYRQLPQ